MGAAGANASGDRVLFGDLACFKITPEYCGMKKSEKYCYVPDFSQRILPKGNK